MPTSQANVRANNKWPMFNLISGRELLLSCLVLSCLELGQCSQWIVPQDIGTYKKIARFIRDSCSTKKSPNKKGNANQCNGLQYNNEHKQCHYFIVPWHESLGTIFLPGSDHFWPTSAKPFEALPFWTLKGARRTQGTACLENEIWYLVWSWPLVKDLFDRQSIRQVQITMSMAIWNNMDYIHYRREWSKRWTNNKFYL